MEKIFFKQEVNNFILKLTENWKGKYLRYKFRNEAVKFRKYNYPYGFIKIYDIEINPRNEKATMVYKEIDKGTGKEVGRKSRFVLDDFKSSEWIIMSEKEFKNELVLINL